MMAKCSYILWVTTAGHLQSFVCVCVPAVIKQICICVFLSTCTKANPLIHCRIGLIQEKNVSGPESKTNYKPFFSRPYLLFYFVDIFICNCFSLYHSPYYIFIFILCFYICAGIYNTVWTFAYVGWG